ncbi:MULTISPECIES: alpha/beta fold hydrolase [Amycolatopsis]|uniref:Pimeloyl-ACP methyl ester carboxylesterase n=2 Tax=Amycolatopsis TaxID=1813 RepID=A0A1I3WM33_9PSEU|nr:alpha/beta hydrolase [Amycolatopsis sacchari]SFK08183.1 Pimeloyl-ACP methyl ester carboxylesterase [Amycolatopsis sacchari]
MRDSDVLDRGHGPAVVFSHGTLLDRTMFDPQIAALGDAYRTIAYTSRAGTSRYGTERSLDDLVADCLDVVDGIDRFVLVGMSVGGFMAIELALKHPERLAGLVLVSTMADAYTPEERARFGALLEPMNTEEPISAEFAEAFVPVIFGPRTISENPGHVERWVRKWRARPSRSVWGEYRSWIDREDRLGRLAEITLPTLIVHGEEDGGIPIARAEAMHARLPRSTFVRVPGSGHLVTEEAPEAVNRALRSFVDGIAPW